MAERLIIPEYYYDSKYWDGHGDKDTCRGEVWLATPDQLARLHEENGRVFRALYQQIDPRTALRGGQAIPLASFTQGDFMPDQYPPGTVIRVHYEMLFLGEEPSYQADKKTGMIVDAQGLIKGSKHAIVYIGKDAALGHEWVPFAVGQVDHFRRLHPQDPKRPRAVQVREESLRRIQEVHILQMGDTAKQSADQKAGKKGWLPRFAPSPR